MYPRSFLLILAAAVCGAISPAWAQGVNAPISIARNYVFPPVGLGNGETASSTVVNVATALVSGGVVTMPAPAPLETYDSSTGATHAVLSNSLANVGPILLLVVPGG